MKKLVRIMALMLVLMLSSVCFAAGETDFVVQRVTVDDDIKVVLYSAYASELNPNTLDITLDGQSVKAKSVKPYSVNSVTKRDNTTWLFIVDTSVVSTNYGNEAVTATLDFLIGNMVYGDNGAVICTGTSYDSIVLKSAGKLSSDIKSMVLNESVTPLNDTVSNAITFAKSHEDVKPRVCIVVISNGENTDENGQTNYELMDLIEGTDITVYTVAFTNDANSANVNAFGALARKSCGGIHIVGNPNTPNKEARDAEGKRIADEIADNESKFVVITIDPASQGVTGTKLCISAKINGFNMKAEMDVEAIPLAPAVTDDTDTDATAEPDSDTTAEPGSDETEDADNTEEITDDSGDDKKEYPFDINTMIIVGGALAAIVIIGIIIIIATRKPRRSAAIDGDDGPPENPENLVPDVNDNIMPINGNISGNNNGYNPTIPDDEAETGVEVTLSVVDAGKSGIYTAMIGNGLIVGRNGEICDITIEDDGKISGRHMLIKQENDMIIVEDCGSRNGTRVNGNRIDRPTIMHQQDIITIGVTSLKITWWTKGRR